jgi:hypothetical protein
VGPPQYLCSCRGDQGPRRRFPPRRCLLKGCEQSFQPWQPQSRYCSAACQQAARRWRRRHASQRYRASTQGKERRREQSQRYRQRRPQPTATLADDAVTAAPAATAAPREGQRPAQLFGNFIWRPCSRPGCYVYFPVQPRSPAQQFCSCLCRQALRRVLDREAHWRRRQRCPQARRRPQSRPPPNSS